MKTQYEKSIRQSFDHVLNYLATEDNSELDKALSACMDAQAQSYTRREALVSRKVASLIATLPAQMYRG